MYGFACFGPLVPFSEAWRRKEINFALVIDLKLWFTLISYKMFIKIFVKMFCSKNKAI
jgi:hypothetical protein